MVLAAATEHVALAASTIVANFADTNTADTAGQFTASINWGDGVITSGTVSGSNGSFSVAGGHTYGDEGSPSASVTVVRSTDNAQITASHTVTVGENDHLTAQNASFNATAGTSFSGTVANFTDTDTISAAGDFSATIVWGDGTTTSGTVSGGSGSFAVSGTHTYAAAGTDAVTVTMRDTKRHCRPLPPTAAPVSPARQRHAGVADRA